MEITKQTVTLEISAARDIPTWTSFVCADLIAASPANVPAYIGTQLSRFTACSGLREPSIAQEQVDTGYRDALLTTPSVL